MHAHSARVYVCIYVCIASARMCVYVFICFVTVLDFIYYLDFGDYFSSFADSVMKNLMNRKENKSAKDTTKQLFSS